MMRRIRKPLDRMAETHERFGVPGITRLALNQAFVRGASLSLVHLLTLDPDDVRDQPFDSSFERRFLTPDEVRRFADDPTSSISPEFADRADLGFDRCFAAIHGDRLANYAWYALGSIEAEHAAGTPLGLPSNVAYVYKAFTHPDFRGRRLNGACMGTAAVLLSAQGVDQLLAMVYWSNEASLRSCERLGFRRVGRLLIGRGGPVWIPRGVAKLGVTFGPEAEAALEARRSEPSGGWSTVVGPAD